ncbi:MAG: hypothetical protein AMS15_03575 [Planctomycetes bacterium DG_23]|nr:MAG: hypothetical protein AMS15_03575 [Planctomycetes bacterium DG_23]
MEIEEEAEIVVIGAGPAGLSASISAALAGAKPIVLDENLSPGGQLFKQIHKFFGSREHFAGKRGFEIGQALLEEAKELNIPVHLETEVLGIFPGNQIVCLKDNKTFEIKARRVILATGARERALAFPGWTIPGVMGAGALQTMMNIHRVLPGRRILIIGAGNVGLIVAHQARLAGAEVVGVVEARSEIGGYFVQAAKILRMGVPIFLNHSIKSVYGRESVEEAEIVRLDECGPYGVSGRRLGVDVVALAVGLLPQTELAQQAGCEFQYNGELGGFIPKRKPNMETSVPGIYVAGDLGGIEEATVAIEEGRLAGVSAAESLGYTPQDKEQKKAEIKSRLAELRYVGEKKSLSLLTRATTMLYENRSPSAGRSMSALRMPSILRMRSAATSRASAPEILIECPEEVPCNPCEEVCPRGAIEIGSPITNLPRYREARCTGCGLCIAACPAQAIFLIDRSFSQGYARLDLPYEELPLPRKQQTVGLLDREGKKIARGRVIKTRRIKAFDKTAVVSVAAPQQIAHSIRYIDCRK